MFDVMHTRRPLELIIHIISWLLVFMFPIIILTGFSESINWTQILHQAIVPLCAFIIFYINFLWLVPKYLLNKDKRRYIIYNIIFILVFAYIMHLSFELIKDGITIPEPPIKPPLFIFYVRDAMLLLIVVCLATALKISMKWSNVEQELIIAQREKVDAELKSLKNQLNPHFLLNTLNNIYALIIFDSEKAQTAVQELSKLLRHVLYDNQQEFVPLSKELEFIRNYISLMKIRLSKNVFLNVTLDDANHPNIKVAPLIFISLIENAFKHGISPTEDSFINISIKVNEDKSISCEILNSNYPKNQEDKSGNGIGLKQLRKRLDILYPGKYNWHISQNETDKTYSSFLTIKTQ